MPHTIPAGYRSVNRLHKNIYQIMIAGIYKQAKNMAIQTATLKQYIDLKQSQTAVAEQLGVAQPSINKALAKNREIYVVYDDTLNQVIKSYEVLPFGRLKNK